MKNLKFLIAGILLLSACSPDEDNNTNIQSDTGEIISGENVNAENELFSKFEKLSLPYTIKSVEIGYPIDNKSFLKIITPDLTDEDYIDNYLKMNNFSAIGKLNETEKYTAVIYLHESEGSGRGKYPQTTEYILTTFNPDYKIIDEYVIGEFSTIEDVTNQELQITESHIVINSDLSISSTLTIILSDKDPENKRIESYSFTLAENGKIKKEDSLNMSGQKLADLLSKEQFEYIVKVKNSYEHIKTAEDIEQIFNKQVPETDQILNNMIFKKDPMQEDLPEKWKFIEDFLPFVIVDEGAEGMGVYASYNTYLLSEIAKRTPSLDDDNFFKIYNEMYEIDDYGVKQYGMPALIEWETDVLGYSQLGSGKFLKTLNLIQEALSKNTCFEKTIKGLKMRILSQLDYYDGYLYTKDQVLTKLEKILEDIDLNEKEMKIVKEAKHSIESKDDGFFNLMH